ncbi:HD domain-containing protein [Cladochytrium replicatum]|nr:HD domain-containing protein [Cladochytrium replicatum]
MLKFLHIIEKLKTTKRTGWVEAEIPDAESISDHMYRMSIMAMVVDDPKLNRSRAVQIALAHDIAESLVGDIAPSAGVSKEDKYKLESDAMDRLVQELGDTAEARELRELWKEYEDGVTYEALFVKDLDKFEMIVQALEYEKRHGKVLQSFYDSTRGKFKHPKVIEWAEELYKERASVSSQ